MKILARTSRWLIAMMAILVAALLAFGPRIAQSFWDESMAVHIKADEIESSTLAIGTHLIHLSALTDSIYEIADKSAEESGQTQIYYKSELGGDTWFDITSASSLEDITTGGAPVTDEEIEALFFTYHTKSDQITYDLRTGEAVNIFDIRDPYDLESMEELSPLKMQYDQIKEFEGDTDVTARIDEIWELPVTGEDAPEEITKYEEQLAALQAYKNVLSENDAEAREIEKVGSVMEAVDAARRYEVFSVVRVALEEYLDELGTGSSGGDSSEEEEVAPEDMDPELMSAVAESLSNVEDALITYGGMMLSEGITVISSAEYEFSNNLINHAVAGNHAACDGDVEDLLLLSNIQNGIVSDRPQELKLLESKLIPNATSEYLALLRKGESAEYRAAVVKNSAQALLNRFINENEGDVETRRGELEFMIQAKCDRIGTQDAMDFVDQRLTLTTETFSAGIPKDAFAETSQGSVDAHIIFLTDLRRTLELALGGNALDQLIAEKEDLQTQYMEKLDNNDLAGAKKLQEQLESLEEEIRSME